VSDFLNDKVTEMLAAASSGNDQALVHAFTEAISENDSDPDLGEHRYSRWR